MRGKLFTQDFLDEGITESAAWRGLDDGELERFAAEVRRLLDAFPVTGTPNESTTEQDLIQPVLEALGWQHYLPQQTTSGRGRRDVPDLLLFPDEAAKTTAQAESQEASRYRHGVAVLEAKRWQRSLDRGEEKRGAQSFLAEGAPSTQMLRYLSRAETVSDGAVRWGILTNGRLWRLYWHGARSRSEEFLEMDLAALSGVRSIQLDLESQEDRRREHFPHVFYLLFRRSSFVPQADDPQGRTFHQLALEESRRWEERVSTELGKVVFGTVFPRLLQSLLAHDREAPSPPTAAYLDELRRAGLTFLYRLLFVLYAEDRNLLPATDRRYDDYSFRKVRQELRQRLDDKDAFSERAATYYGRLQKLFTVKLGSQARKGPFTFRDEWNRVIRSGPRVETAQTTFPGMLQPGVLTCAILSRSVESVRLDLLDGAQTYGGATNVSIPSLSGFSVHRTACKYARGMCNAH